MKTPAVSSPVQISATANVSGGVYRFELWNGNTKLLSVDNGVMDQTVTLAPGTYHLTFDARNSSGDHQYAYRDITVTGSSGGACTAPTSEGVNVCSPAENATVTSPVQINAAATVNGGIVPLLALEWQHEAFERGQQRHHGPNCLVGAGHLPSDVRRAQQFRKSRVQHIATSR